MRERTVERRFKLECDKRGALCWKFVVPGMSGVPDRIVLLDDGRIVFAEIKAPGEKLRPLQEKRCADMQMRGHLVYVIDSVESIGAFMREVFGE